MLASSHSANLSATAANSSRSAQVSIELLQLPGLGFEGMIVIEITFKIPAKTVIMVPVGIALAIVVRTVRYFTLLQCCHFLADGFIDAEQNTVGIEPHLITDETAGAHLEVGLPERVGVHQLVFDGVRTEPFGTQCLKMMVSQFKFVIGLEAETEHDVTGVMPVTEGLVRKRVVVDHRVTVQTADPERQAPAGTHVVGR
jgi:hypothetical protein